MFQRIRQVRRMWALGAAAGVLSLALLGTGLGSARGSLATARPALADTLVSVAPQAGGPTDTYTFSFSGFTPGETVAISVKQPADAADLPAPDIMTATAGSDGSGSISLRPADAWGPVASGDWTVTFTGETSGASHSATVSLDCGC
jgi:hypothetical protein